MLSSSESIRKSDSIYLAWFVCTMFFFYQYMLRALPNILSQEIFTTFKVTAEEFSTLGSIYLMTYGILQIPIGFLLDRVSLRKISFGAILLCIGSAILFSVSNDFYMMQVSRFFLACGSAAALGITLKLISANCIGMTRSVLSGITLTVGVLGPILGGKIVQYVLSKHEWQIASIMIGFSGFILFIASFVFVKNVSQQNVFSIKEIIAQFKNVFSSKVLIYSIIAGGIYIPPCVLADLWGTRFLSAKFSISEGSAIDISLSLYYGLAVGSLILPYCSEKIKNLDLIIILSLLCNTGLLCTLLFISELSIENLYFLLMMIGFFCGAEMICFNAAWRIVPSNCTALTVGVINSFSLIFIAIFQQVIGILMDSMWNGELTETGLRIYSKDDYILGISAIPAVLFACFAISLLLKKTNKG